MCDWVITLMMENVVGSAGRQSVQVVQEDVRHDT